MPAAYPLHLAREIDRRWLQRLPLDRTSPLDRPKHPNDIRLRSKPSQNDRTKLVGEPTIGDARRQQDPSRDEKRRSLMDF
jgi:hypothetical protein